MKQLYLRGLYGEYVKTNRDQVVEIYHSFEKGNTIVFEPFDDDVNTESICNGIRNEAYFYLIDKLNSSKGITVNWTQVSGTTSDYDIFCDLQLSEKEVKSTTTVLNILENEFHNSKFPVGYKYREFRNGKGIKIQV